MYRTAPDYLTNKCTMHRTAPDYLTNNCTGLNLANVFFKQLQNIYRALCIYAIFWDTRTRVHLSVSSRLRDIRERAQREPVSSLWLRY